MPKAALKETFILMTNLSYVSVGRVRTHTCALLLEENEDVFTRGALRRRIRGFGVEASWETFDMGVPSIEYELQPFSGGPIMMSGGHPEGRPLFKGGVMQMKDGPALTLVTSDHDHDLRIDRIEGKAGDRTILSVLERIPQFVQKFWNAPNIPRLVYQRNPDCRF